MQIANTPRRWGAPSQLLHWLVVWLIVGQFVLADEAEELPLGLAKLAVLATHKSVGISIWVLAMVRLLWRLKSPGPQLPASMSRLQRALAHGSHHAMYALLFLTPLVGWAMSSAKNYTVSWFNLIELPNLVAPNEPLFMVLRETHEWLASSLGVLASIHASAALWHHFVKRDDVLKRMLPFTSVFVGAVALSMLLASSPVEAAQWASDRAKSTLQFTFTQAGARNTGAFENFTVTLVAANETLVGGNLRVDIDTRSLNTRDKDRDSVLQGVDLFDVARFPRARFEAVKLLAKSPNQIEAQGRLTLRGVTKPLRLMLTSRTAKEGAQSVIYLTGATRIKRLDFAIGQKDWQSTEWVANEVEVSWSIRLAPNR